jgi:inner membrane protein
MAPGNHAFISWWTANVLPLSRRDRLVVFLAGVLPDLDGLTLFVSEEAYVTYHHVIAHNLLVGLLWTALVALFAQQRLSCATLALLNWHLHLACDYFGSAGPGNDVWVLPYLYPFLGSIEANGHFTGPAWYWNPWQWELNAWPNILVALLGAASWVYIAVRLDRTWFEFVSLRLDKELCRTLRNVLGGQPVKTWTETEGRLVRRSFVALATVALLACAVAASRVAAASAG